MVIISKYLPLFSYLSLMYGEVFCEAPLSGAKQNRWGTDSLWTYNNNKFSSYMVGVIFKIR